MTGTDRAHSLVSAILLVVGLAIFTMAFFKVAEVYQQQWPDRGARPLIVIAADGPSEPYAVEVESSVDPTGRYRIGVSFRLAENVPADDRSRPAASFVLTVVGAGLDKMITCGQRAPRLLAFDGLDEATREAYVIDRDASVSSAVRLDDVKAQLQFASIHGKLELLLPGQDLAAQDEFRARYVQECTLRPGLLWAPDVRGNPMDAVRSTLLAPEVNVVAVPGKQNGLSQLIASLRVARAPGANLVEAVPTAVPDVEGWSVMLATQEVQGRVGARTTLIADQATWMFQNRTQARTEEVTLLLGGIVLGFALSLFEGGASGLFRDFVLLQRRPAEAQVPNPMGPRRRG